MQSAGWSIAAYEDPQSDILELIMRHENLELVAQSQRHSWKDVRFDPRNICLRMRVVAKDIHVHNYESIPSYRVIDARPEPVRFDHVTSLYDLPVFRDKRGEEVMYQQADMSVVEHLEAIRKLQAPKQDQLRETALRNEHRQENVISLIGIKA